VGREEGDILHVPNDFYLPSRLPEEKEGESAPCGLALFNLMSKAKETVAEFLYKREMNIEQGFYYKLK
jgi:hypothetical protein